MSPTITPCAMAQYASCGCNVCCNRAERNPLATGEKLPTRHLIFPYLLRRGSLPCQKPRTKAPTPNARESAFPSVSKGIVSEITRIIEPGFAKRFELFHQISMHVRSSVDHSLHHVTCVRLSK